MTDLRNPTASAIGQQTQQPQPPTQNVIMAKPLKVKPSETYEKTRGGLKAFFSQVELYFGLNTKQFPKDKLKVLFASTYLQGLAINWFNSFLCDFLENTLEDRGDDTNEITQSYAKFKKKPLGTLTMNMWWKKRCKAFDKLDPLLITLPSFSNMQHRLRGGMLH